MQASLLVKLAELVKDMQCRYEVRLLADISIIINDM